ncbi:hypothetical protein Tsubulata_013978, partial [Turnera subulata]
WLLLTLSRKAGSKRLPIGILSGMGITGTLSGDIGDLLQLQTLYVSSFLIDFPPAVTRLATLCCRIMDLSQNQGLKGPLPASIVNLNNLQTLSLASNNFIGPIPPSIGNLSNLYLLDLTDNKLNGTIPVSSETSPGLDLLLNARHLRLDRNSFGGPILLNFTSLTNLSELYLSNNKFTGAMPDLSGMNLLTYVIMERTQLQGPIPDTLFSPAQLQSGNPYCGKTRSSNGYCISSQLPNSSYSTAENCMPASCKANQVQSPNCNCARPISGTLQFKSFSFSDFENATYFISLDTVMMEAFKNDRLPVDSISLSVPIRDSNDYLHLKLDVFPSATNQFNRTGFSLITSQLNNITFIKTASWDQNKSSGTPPLIKGVKSFSFEELKKCTNNFSETNIIGSGGYGKVYVGILTSGAKVAIKRAQQGSLQGSAEFKNEIELLSRLHHKNLVSLVGFCYEQGEQMLVYEYISNGTLMENISARGLAYLHEFAHPPIIHRDIKSNNILLDDHLIAKVADFGLSKPFGTGEGHITTGVKGTMGYMDPEYFMTEQLTEKSDVYSFGVVMLELITGRKPIEHGTHIVRAVRTAMDKTKDLYNLQEMLAPAIGLSTKLKGLEKLVDLALRCCEEARAKRPTMGEVVKELENILQLAGLDYDTEMLSTSVSYSGTTTEGSFYGSSDKGNFQYSGSFPHFDRALQ